jgi:deoxyribodipyrimidine photo-lyase
VTASHNRAICWLRRDLRLYDHVPLARATREFGQVAVVFVFDTTILDALDDRDDRRVSFIHRSLVEIDSKLRELDSKLVVLHGDPVEEIPRLASKLDARAVFAGRDYEPSAIARDDEVDRQLQANGSRLELFKDQVFFEAGEVLGATGRAMTVYTPYARAWKARFLAERDAAEWEPDLRVLIPASEIEEMGAPRTMEDLGFAESKLWLEPGERAGRQRLEGFKADMADYAQCRDFPAQEATSGLSAHLRFGTVSIRDCFRAALAAGLDGEKWFSELVWREFYADILGNNPSVVHGPLQRKYRDLEYPGIEEHWRSWCDGQTGYPLVDAAMRCLRETGWMHNRLRMVSASFLTKDLLIDYRRGEAWFARHLLDFDLANNNGGWQWAAGTGADAQPYFRIFNPVLQSRRFDPEGEFIRRWVREIAHLDAADIHWPHGQLVDPSGYPAPIVDHDVQRKLAIRLLESATKSLQ